MTALANRKPPQRAAAGNLPMSIADVMEMATAAAKSGLFAGIGTPEAAFTLMMLCHSEGLHPMQALRRFDIIDGKPSMKADAILAEFLNRGGMVEWHRNDHEECRATFTAPGLKTPVTVSWTIADAQRAGLLRKNNWMGYPRQMLRARVISEGVRMSMPAVVVGIYTPEEVEDFDAPAGEADGPRTILTVAPTGLKRLTIETPGAPDKPEVIPGPKASAPSAGAASGAVLVPASSAKTSVAQPSARSTAEPAGDHVESWKWHARGEEWISIGLQPKASRDQIVRLEILKRETEIAEDDYRKGLRRYNKASSTELDRREIGDYIDRLEAKKAQQAAKASRQNTRAVGVLRKIGQVLPELHEPKDGRR